MLSVKPSLQRIGLLEPNPSGLGTEAPELCDRESGWHETGQARLGYSSSLCFLLHPSCDLHSRLPIEEATGQKAMATSARRPTWLLMGTLKGK